MQSLTYAGGGLSYTQSFAYDALNRLTTSRENSGSNWSQTNGYDRYGNRWIDLGGGNQSLYFTSSNRITGGSYDNAGNLLSDGTHSYQFDAENKIRKIDNNLAYVYDGDGQRVRKLLGENVRLVYGPSGHVIAEFDGSTGALKKEYIYGENGLIATIEPSAVNSNGTRYVTSDYLGSPRVVTSSAASVVSRHDYMPFGEELGTGLGGRTVGAGFGVTDGLRQKFTQHERDTESGLDYFQARYYSSSQGRFISIDPQNAGAERDNPQSWNAYSYALNNPLKYSDPSGLATICRINGQPADCATVLNNLQNGNFDTTIIRVGGQTYVVRKSDYYKIVQTQTADGTLVSTITFNQTAFLRAAANIAGLFQRILEQRRQQALGAGFGGGGTFSGGGSGGCVCDGVGTMRRLQYVGADYHRQQATATKNPAPRNGQAALDNSLPVTETSTRRVGIDYDAEEFVVFDETSPGEFHGHVRSWEELRDEMKNVLIKSGMVTRRGKIIPGGQ